MENINRSSIWHGSFGQYPMLKTAISTDVLIIGGGISGILAARLLTDSGVPCVIAEAGRICGGIYFKFPQILGVSFIIKRLSGTRFRQPVAKEQRFGKY